MSIKLSEAIGGFIKTCQARRLSGKTLKDYHHTLSTFAASLEGDPSLKAITADQVVSFLDQPQLSKKTILNKWIGLSAFWSWGMRHGHCEIHLIRRIPRPRPTKRKIRPFTQIEVTAMLKACRSLRDQAMLLTMVDTGLRASELCNLRLADFERTELHLLGKGDKERDVPISPTTCQAIQKYLETRHGQSKESRLSPLFLSERRQALTPSGLALFVRRIAKRAEVTRAHPHRFRHTFAISFLRNGGDVFTLKEILGHSTLYMTQIYLAIAKSDVQRQHSKASPVTRWKLNE